MWANSVWGLFTLSCSCVLTMLGLSPDSPWQPLLLFGGVLFMLSSLAVLSWPLHVRDNRVKFAALIAHPARATKLIEPLHVIAFGLAIAVAGAVWQMRKPDKEVSTPPTPPAEIVIRPSPKASTTPRNDRLVANVLPPIPDTAAELISRYAQLKGLLDRTVAAIDTLGTTAGGWLNSQKPSPPGTPNRTGSFHSRANYERWQSTVEALKNINNSAYKNREFDTETVPELANPLLKAPGEDAFGDDGVGAYNYRKFYFLNTNIDKGAKLLMADIQQELSAAKIKIEAIPAGKALIE